MYLFLLEDDYTMILHQQLHNSVRVDITENAVLFSRCIASFFRHFDPLHLIGSQINTLVNRLPIVLITLLKVNEGTASQHRNGPVSQFLGPFGTIALVNGQVNVFETNLGHAEIIKVRRLLRSSRIRNQKKETKPKKGKSDQDVSSKHAEGCALEENTVVRTSFPNGSDNSMDTASIPMKPKVMRKIIITGTMVPILKS